MRSGAPEAGAEALRETVDAFHRGRFWLVQPADKGHRAGLDAMLLAAAAPRDFAGRLADLGAGAGAAGLAVAARCAQAAVTLVEAAPAMARYAERSIALDQNRHLTARASVLAADVTLAGDARAAAGLADRSFDFAIMNPPFNASEDRTSPDELRQLAYVMDDGMFERWIRTAAAVVKPRGGLALIARPASLGLVIDAVRGRFGSTKIKPIHPRADVPAIRFVLRARKGARGALSLMPPLVLHEGGANRLTPEADAICNGEAALFGN